MIPLLQTFKAALSPSAIAHWLQTLDRASGILLASVWGGAVVIMLLVFLTAGQALRAGQEADAALASRPLLPTIERSALSQEQLRPLAERLGKRFPQLTIDAQPTGLQIRATAPELFSDWLNAIVYADAMAVGISWTLTEFCAGPECPNKVLMSALLRGERVALKPADIH